jgi:hypothetical protein
MLAVQEAPCESLWRLETSVGSRTKQMSLPGLSKVQGRMSCPCRWASARSTLGQHDAQNFTKHPHLLQKRSGFICTNGKTIEEGTVCFEKRKMEKRNGRVEGPRPPWEQHGGAWGRGESNVAWTGGWEGGQERAHTPGQPVSIGGFRG